MNGSGFLAMVLLSVAAAGGSTEEVGADFFEARVRPVLVEKCLDCHGEDEPEGGLRMTSRTNLLKGGQGGPVVVEGKPAESRLMAAIRRDGALQMPPDGKLTAGEIEALARWIEHGLPWPAPTASSAGDQQTRSGRRPSALGVPSCYGPARPCRPEQRVAPHERRSLCTGEARRRRIAAVRHWRTAIRC